MMQSDTIRSYAPCGECRDYVPRATGCTHWRPGEPLTTMRDRQRKAKRRAERRESVT